MLPEFGLSLPQHHAGVVLYVETDGGVIQVKTTWPVKKLILYYQLITFYI